MGAVEGNAPRELTGEERQLYDRQIRLWGAEAQRRLSTGRLLIVGDVLSPLAQELAKDVVLAGVASVTLVPHVTKNGANGFLGSTVEKLSDSLRGMNPLVEVKTGTDAQMEAGPADIVCSVGCHLPTDRSLSIHCAAMGTPMLCGRIAGFIGWFHLGLGDFKYTPEGKEEKQENFPCLEDAWNVPWGGERKRSAFAWHIASALLAFELEYKRMPGLESDDFSKFYKELAAEKGATLTAPDELVDSVAKCASHELAALAAIVGGVWGREVVKVLSRRDAPLNNFFLYNARTSVGAVESVGGKKE